MVIIITMDDSIKFQQYTILLAIIEYKMNIVNIESI